MPNYLPIQKMALPLHPKQANDSVAQLVEQMTLNHWVESSSLSGVTRLEAVSESQLLFLFQPNSLHSSSKP